MIFCYLDEYSILRFPSLFSDIRFLKVHLFLLPTDSHMLAMISFEGFHWLTGIFHSSDHRFSLFQLTCRPMCYKVTPDSIWIPIGFQSSENNFSFHRLERYFKTRGKLHGWANGLFSHSPKIGLKIYIRLFNTLL